MADGPSPLATFTYDLTGNRLSKNLENGIQSVYTYDALNRLTQIVHQPGVETLSYTYDSMNRRTNETRTTTGTRFLFTGRKWLAPLGLYDYRNRTYSPTLGRFLQTDSIRFHAGDVNLYRYVGNNSLFWRDPYGLCPGCGSKSIDWGSGGASKGNCWRYACDDPMKPGEEHSPFPRGKDPGGHVTCDQVIAGTKAKGATDPEKGGCCPKGFRLIKAVIQDKTKPGWNDYHWYRYEGGGKWTHKPGSGKVEETKDPTKDAADRGYDKDCGNLCVHENADVD